MSQERLNELKRIVRQENTPNEELPDLVDRNQKKQEALEEVYEKVKERLSIPTLKYRNLDRLDFHEVSVGAINDVIEMAFEAGRKFGSEG
jgi:hypothetical protein